MLGLVLPTLSGCFKSPPTPQGVEIHPIRPVSAQEAQQFVGSPVCASCHPEQSAAHRQSYHARALTQVSAATHGDRFRRPSDKSDPERGLRFRTEVAGDQCVLGVQAKDGGTGVVAARFGFGAGKHATTYMGDFRGDLLELRLTYYSDARRWDFSPGQQLTEKISGGILYPQGLVKAPDVVEGCFVCHSTAVVKEGGRVLRDQVLMGVGCESCHGPGREHLAAVQRKDKDLKMARLSQAKERVSTELCGQCHRSPVNEDLHDPFNQSQLPRLQGLALSQSACFTNSGGKLSCLTCHDPHSDARATDAEYRRACLSCHTGASRESRNCSIDPKGDCVPCHMPKQSVGMPTGLRYRNHWIKVWGTR